MARDGSEDPHTDTNLKPAFKAWRFNATTFVINEHKDSYDEQPLIYAKLLPGDEEMVIIDTGCGGATKDPKIDLKSLRTFIETVQVRGNNDKPLNEGGKMKYVIVLTHCHYDHILGVEQFAKDSTIVVSGHSPSFLAPEQLPSHSLCEDLHIRTPQYKPVLVPHLHEIQLRRDHSPGSSEGTPPRSGLVVLHTPGHTPDELAVWDTNERVLFVGDTLYEYAHIIFPNEGSIVDWMHSVDLLLKIVGTEEAQICCGHVTAGRPAQEVLASTKAFIADVISGKEVVKRKFEKRGEINGEYVQDSKRYSLVCPERLILEAREAQ
ncbi:hypothetical protein PHLGIDRAFT_120190 [Phlebiopsis gigantea 11061_1 CR5-6]|uniref:Metallo-beta-lactamase domain-containing protein n=1 Tax=Phlebiopsis gigantea (strain 11061_1 CR5-6) TaxID=745531 RepID=A0A0C3PGU2_PHLG1|nr:hypothetical protein PHLGIDRAFT_120190 [Phlebiopsis gigantea 11061_1 CR5-6]